MSEAQQAGRRAGLSAPEVEAGWDDEAIRDTFRHSASHVMAAAVKRLYPQAKLGIGPAIEDRFYYDFDVPGGFGPEDLARIEAEMRRVVAEDHPFRREELTRDEAQAMFCAIGEPYKLELARELPDGVPITIYRSGDFVDLCAGPHVSSTGQIAHFKLLSLAGAYWRGDERNPMLQRIYGTAFPSQRQLDEYLHRLEEARKRDHRLLGQQLGLFSMHDEGRGFPFWHDRGLILWRLLEDFWRQEHRKRGYQEIKTPMILCEDLWRRSGHWDHYRENMYFVRIDETPHAVKPMNCPGSMLLYKMNLHSYREFPLRVAEFGVVHRHEMSGTLHGLLRVRSFTQDDAHIFMMPEQLKDEIIGVIELCDHIYRAFGLDYHVELSTRPANAMGSAELWDKATLALRQALEEKGMAYKINAGDGAFYGPKIDFHVRDSLGRTWQCGTIQADFQMPERFDLTYIGPDGAEHRPVMIHRVVYGAMERFIGLLIEEYAGAFPVWLAPVQVRVVPIADRHQGAAKDVAARLESAGVRVEVDLRNEKVGFKIRSGEMDKIPYMAVVGDREAASGQVAVRKRGQGDLGSMAVDAFIGNLLGEVASKAR
jgi:threonyl-tRNA synthetase